MELLAQASPPNKANLICSLISLRSLNDLDRVDPALWPAVACAHRLALTASNVETYIAEHGVDLALAQWLSTAGAIMVGEGDATPVGPLALNILNAKALGDNVKLGLVDGLGLEAESIAAASLQADAHPVSPALVKKELVADGADAYTSLGDDEWAMKKELISVSEEFPTYMTELPLGTDELYWIASQSVPDAVKDVLLAELERFAPQLGPKGASALADWAANTGRTPTAEAIVTMAAKGGSGSARPILKLLGAQASTIDLELLKGALNALGKPYDQLTSPGWDRPKVNIADGVAAVLARLRKASIVSKFEENSKKHVFEVSKRHS